MGPFISISSTRHRSVMGPFIIGLFAVPYYGYGCKIYGPVRVFLTRTRTVQYLALEPNGTVRDIRRPYYGQQVIY
jgi:hypothetical protein